jgi:hypothetical protein
VVFASLLSKCRLYSIDSGQELGLVETAWPGERVPPGALEALQWSVCHDRNLRASWVTLLARLAEGRASVDHKQRGAQEAEKEGESPSLPPPPPSAAERAAAEYLAGLSEVERELAGVEEATRKMMPEGGDRAELARLW